MTQHTPEPWTTNLTNIVGGDRTVVTYNNRPTGSHHPTDNANARRIVDCINACQGISAPQRFIELARKCMRQIGTDHPEGQAELRQWAAEMRATIQ